MNNPYITIIVPFWNSAATLKKCIESILQQTIVDWELILVDDGSTDESAKVCNQYVKNDWRIQLIHRSHEGVAAARNAALDIAAGTKLCFIDADDTVEPDYLEGLCSYPEVEMTVCGYMVDQYSKTGQILSTENHFQPELFISDITERYKLENAFASGIMHINCNKLYDMSVIRKYNLRYKFFPVNEDFIFVMEYLLHTSTVAFIPKPLYHWIRTEGIMTSVHSIPQNILQIYEYSHLLLSEYLHNEKIADRIAYRSYELLIYKYLELYKKQYISKSECFKLLNELHQSKMTKRAFTSYCPITPVEKIIYIFNKMGLFHLTHLLQTLILRWK